MKLNSLNSRSVLTILIVAIVCSAIAYQWGASTVSPVTLTVTSYTTSYERIFNTFTMVTTLPITITATITRSVTQVRTERLSPPVVPRGMLVIMGGITFDEAYWKIIEGSGGGSPKVGIIPTASSTPYDTGSYYVDVFRSYGADAVLVDITETNCGTTAYSDEIVNLIESLDAVFFTGGDQNRITKCLIRGGEPTPALRALWDLYMRGGLISGNSAGAAIMSDPMIGGGMDEGVLIVRGLGFLLYGQVIVDQHYLARGRFLRHMEALMQTNTRFGVGIDEGSALVCSGEGSCAVIGFTPVVFVRYDGFNGTYHKFMLTYLTPGDSLEIAKYRSMVNASKNLISSGELQGAGSAPPELTRLIDIKSPEGLSSTIKLLLQYNEVSITLKSESGKVTYDLVFRRTSDTAIYETEFFGASRYSALNILLLISKK